MKKIYTKPETHEYHIAEVAYLQVTSQVGISSNEADPDAGMDTKGDSGWDIW